MAEIPVLNHKQVVKVLGTLGFIFVRQKGSHQMYRKGQHLVVVPCHPGDLKRGTIRSVIIQTGVDVDTFLKLL